MGDKAEAKQEGFFHQLRRIVSVEKEISKLQIEVLHGRSSDNPQDGTAVLLLRDIQDDLKQRKVWTTSINVLRLLGFKLYISRFMV